MKYPHVCNGCETKITCKLGKKKSNAKYAEDNYRNSFKTSRTCISKTLSEIVAMDELITPLIKKNNLYLIYMLLTRRSSYTLSELYIITLIGDCLGSEVVIFERK